MLSRLYQNSQNLHVNFSIFVAKQRLVYLKEEDKKTVEKYLEYVYDRNVIPDFRRQSKKNKNDGIPI